MIKSFKDMIVTAHKIIAIPTKSIGKNCSFIIKKAKNTAEIGSIEANKLDLTGPTILPPFRKAV